METLKGMLGMGSADAIRSYQGGYFKILISPEQTSGNMALIDMTLPRGVEPPMHVHTREDETFYILKGNMTFVIGETVTKGVVGDAVFAPRQVPHHFVIESESARFLTLITPGQFVEYFLEFSVPADDEVKLMPPQGPPPTEIIEYMISQLKEKYGVLNSDFH
ncbi:Cupin domain-containing protein [Gelidibacter algens]|uniref:Cupin domain-containing protein n=1 Tax=Gelidibacter algens TaxID=49280 RepID=A0A1A7R0W7_9FLAO|nr:cupin domain-containing protein [Gelidibacter algens]OBX25119.1 hypothetical protein A9996_11480 [Gelidibacter algens]RAJ20007.1 Cupin domain-containing protein [Gelidibacter algens]